MVGYGNRSMHAPECKTTTLTCEPKSHSVLQGICDKELLAGMHHRSKCCSSRRTCPHTFSTGAEAATLQIALIPPHHANLTF